MWLQGGEEQHLAAAIMEAVRGPATPTAVTSSVRLGVRRKGTWGRGWIWAKEERRGEDGK